MIPKHHTIILVTINKAQDLDSVKREHYLHKKDTIMKNTAYYGK
jgi:hypothetical protein